MVAPQVEEQGKVECVEMSQDGAMEKEEAMNLALLEPEEMGGNLVLWAKPCNPDCTRARATSVLPLGAKHKENLQDMP